MAELTCTNEQSRVKHGRVVIDVHRWRQPYVLVNSQMVSLWSTWYRRRSAAEHPCFTTSVARQEGGQDEPSVTAQRKVWSTFPIPLHHHVTGHLVRQANRRSDDNSSCFGSWQFLLFFVWMMMMMMMGKIVVIQENTLSFWYKNL